MKKVIVLLVFAAFAANVVCAKTVDEVIVVKKGGNYYTHVLNHYDNDVCIVYRAPVSMNNQDLKNLGIPKEVWPQILKGGDMVFSLNYYNAQKEIEILNKKLKDEEARAREQNAWLCGLGIACLIFFPLAVSGLFFLSKYHIDKKNREARRSRQAKKLLEKHALNVG